MILCYHNVGEAGRGWLGQARSIPLDRFEAQMRWLKSVADVVPLDEIARAGGRPRRHQVAITFDDGYLNNVDSVIFTICQEYSSPTTGNTKLGVASR